MNRHAQALMLALAIAATGCAGGRAALPPAPDPAGVLDPVEATPTPRPEPAEPTRASLREGKIPLDRHTVRTSHEMEVEDAPEAAAEAADEPATRPRPAPPAEAAKRPDPKPDEPMSIRTDPDLAPGQAASRTAAVVGDTIITFRELKLAVCQRLGLKPYELRQQMEASPEQKKQINEVAKDTLDSLIDRTLILQEGRRQLKKPEQWTLFTDYVEKAWREKELPPMMRKAGVEDEIALRKKMEVTGESLDDVKDAWKAEQMSREFLMMRVQPKVEKPNLPEMEAYYAKHRNDPGYKRDAKVKWREIVVAAEKPEDLAAARKQAQALRARLLAGEDFAALAKAASAGVTAAQGGAWATAPDGTAVPAVNAALANLAPGQISAPIDGPKGVHLVRVESRRNAGIAPFVEVQREIAEAIFSQRFQDEISGYLKRLRDKTSISSPLFQGTESAPTVVEEKAKVDAAARRTAR